MDQKQELGSGKRRCVTHGSGQKGRQPTAWGDLRCGPRSFKTLHHLEPRSWTEIAVVRGKTGQIALDQVKRADKRRVPIAGVKRDRVERTDKIVLLA